MSRKRKSGKIINVISSYVVGKHTLGMSQYIYSKKLFVKYVKIMGFRKYFIWNFIKLNLTLNDENDFIKDIDKRLLSRLK